VLPRATFPSGYNPADTIAVQVPRALVPLIAQGVALWEDRRYWKENADYEAGYQAALLLQERLLG
jgi:hypothetical protein